MELQSLIEDKERELAEQQNENREIEKEFSEYRRQKERELAEQREITQQLQAANIKMSNAIRAGKTSSDDPNVSYSVHSLWGRWCQSYRSD